MKVTGRLAGLAAAHLLLGACAMSLAPHQQTFENVQLLRADDMPPMALGKFRLAEGRPASMDRTLGIRADSVKPPDGLTFSGYLRQVLEAELTGAGKLDPSSQIVVSADLTQSTVSTSGENSTGALGARFHVTRDGVMTFDKELVVTGEWPSSFFGAEAIPQAMFQYNGFYPKLVTRLLSDPDFNRAIKAR